MSARQTEGGTFGIHNWDKKALKERIDTGEILGDKWLHAHGFIGLEGNKFAIECGAFWLMVDMGSISLYKNSLLTFEGALLLSSGQATILMIRNLYHTVTGKHLERIAPSGNKVAEDAALIAPDADLIPPTDENIPDDPGLAKLKEIYGEKDSQKEITVEEGVSAVLKANANAVNNRPIDQQMEDFQTKMNADEEKEIETAKETASAKSKKKKLADGE